MKRSLLLLSLCTYLSSAYSQIYDTIPVIFHIIHNGESVGTGSNISQLQVNSQLDVLNEDYRMLNADRVNTPAVWAPLIGDMGLNFEPALFDPNGNPLIEPGIDRVNRNSMGWTTPPYNTLSYIDNTIKPQSIWDPTRYLNIWVLNMNNGMLGYPTFPSINNLGCTGFFPPDTLRDGIVLYYIATGRVGNIQSPFHKGRSATYLIGEWLGLRRLAQSNCGDDCVPDTPLGDYSYGGAPTFPQVSSTCGNGPDGDMFMNFMSYVDDSSKVMFTQGQKARIDTVLTNGYFQSALRLSNVYLSVNELSFAGAGVFPNPSSGNVTIALQRNADCDIRLFNVLGEEVLHSRMEKENRKELSVAGLPGGVYILKLENASSTVSRKLIIQQ